MTGEPKKQDSSKINNYYKMPKSEVDKYIQLMNRWLFTHPKDHIKYEHVVWAHKVAWRAKEIERDDPFIRDVIETIT